MGIEETIRKELEIYAEKKGEYKKAVEVAETCLKEGLSVELTTKISKLSLFEVKTIANRLGLNK